MNCFLIDFENVNSGGMKGIEHLTENDDVYIFYSDHANSITFDIHHKMNRSTANIHFFKSEIIGKNSLDFQIVSYMGYLVAQKKYQNYFLVSIDRGFDYAVKFWKNYFKQNKIYDLEINRYYSIQDGLNKKSTGSDTRQSNRKVPPTIPTVESEIELQQIKAENVIIDRTSPTIEKHIEKNLNTSTSMRPKTASSTIKSSSKTYNKNHSATVSQSANANKSAFVNRNNDTPKPTNNTTNDTPVQIKDTLVGSNPNAKKLDNVETINATTTPASDSKELNKYPKNPNNNRNSNNNKKLFNQQKKTNYNTPNNNRKNNQQNVENKFNKNKPESQKPVFTEQYKQPEENAIKNDKTTLELTTQPKNFTFGKINLDDNAVVTENIKNKTVLTKPSTEVVKEVSKPSTDNKPKDVTPKKEDVPNGKSAKPSEEKPTATPEKVETKPQNAPKPKPKKESSKATAKDAPKRKVGRPRTRPVQDESKKPKNNKSFEQEIPKEKLTGMLEKVAQIDHLNGYSYDDKVKICKVIVFSDTKQNCYRAFMSCFGKLKGVEIYGAVKPIFQAIRDLYIVSQTVSQN